MSMKLILLGAPGAGKGTQGEFISKTLGIPTISTGTILRNAIAGETEIGKQAKSYMDSGKLAPDDIIIKIVTDRLAESDCKDGFILDGVPRTIVQAEALERAGVMFDCVLSIEISDEEITGRMAGRRVCEDCGGSYHMVARTPKVDGICDSCGGVLVQRKDDIPEMVLSRLKVYHDETEPLKDFYKAKGMLKCVQNIPNITQMSTAMLEALKA